jgi:hypothetical protein
MDRVIEKKFCREAVLMQRREKMKTKDNDEKINVLIVHTKNKGQTTELDGRRELLPIDLGYQMTLCYWPYLAGTFDFFAEICRNVPENRSGEQHNTSGEQCVYCFTRQPQYELRA